MNTIQIGSIGPDVLYMQALIGHNCWDGSFGPKTDIALKEFLKKNGLLQDGQCGPKTWNLLFSLNPRTAATRELILAVASELGVDYASVMAIKEVESGGKTSFTPEGRPIALHEGHIFWKYLKNDGYNPEELGKGNEDIVYPKWTKAFYKTKDEEYKLIDRAFKIARKPAVMSSSLGLFLIMGFNYSTCGCKSPEEFWGRSIISEAEQIKMFASFIKANKKMHLALLAKDWAGFAKLYNGPEYAQNKYDIKLLTAYNKYK